MTPNPSRVAARYHEAVTRLYHISGWGELSDAKEGDTFTLKPGRQNAEGPGVYFSEGVPVKVTTAEGTSLGAAATAVVETEASGTAGWWRTKPALARKFNRPITWHTDGKSLSCKVESVGTVPVSGTGGLPLLKSECSFSRVAARYKSKKKIETKDGDEATVYEYSEKQIANRNRDKAEKVEHLRKNISDLRARVRDDLTDSDPMTRMTALAVSLIDETCERVGNEGSAEDGHYGVTVWEAGHVSFKGNTAIIKYVGKSGVDHTKTVDDGPTVKALKELVKGRGKDEFIFDTDDAKVCSDDVNDYLAEFDITAKDIRGYRANDEMCKALRAERAKGPKELPYARKEKDEILGEEFKRALETVAEIVGHTEGILRSSYLVPGLEDAYTHDGTVLKSLKVGTKTDAQREDEATEKLVKPSPKAKPPRHDLRNERVEVEKDPDLDTTDDDLSLNYKKVASPVRVAMALRVANRFLVAAQADEDAFRSWAEGQGSRFTNPKTKKKVTFSTLEKAEPKAAQKIRKDWAKKNVEQKDAPKDDKDSKGRLEEKKNPSKETDDSEEPAPESLRKEITDSIKNVKVNLSASTAKSLDSLHTSVTKGMSEVDLERLADDATKQAKKIVNMGAKALGEGKAIPRDTFKVPPGMYKLTSGKGGDDGDDGDDDGDDGDDDGKPQDFDSKKSGASIKSLVTKRDELAKSLVESKEATEKATAALEAAKKSLPDLQETTSRKERELAEAERGRGEVDKKLKKLEGSEDTAAVSALEKERRDLDARVGKSKDDLNHAKKEVEKADGSIKENQDSLRKLGSASTKTTDALAKHTDALITATAYHTAMTHLTGLMSDPARGGVGPGAQESAVEELLKLPPNIRKERSQRGTERVKEIQEVIKTNPKGAKELRAELAAIESDQVASKFVDAVGSKDSNPVNALIRSSAHKGVGDPHVQALLKDGMVGAAGRKAVFNITDDMTDEDLIALAGGDKNPLTELLKDPDSTLREGERKAIRATLIDRMLYESGNFADVNFTKSMKDRAKGLVNNLKDKGKGFLEAVREVLKNYRGDGGKTDTPPSSKNPKPENAKPEKAKPEKAKPEKATSTPDKDVNFEGYDTGGTTSEDTPQTPAEIKVEAEEFAKHIKDPVERAKVFRRLKKMSPDEMLAMMGAAMADDEGEEGGTPVQNKAASSPLRVASRFLRFRHGFV